MSSTQKLEYLSRRFFVETMITWDRGIFRLHLKDFKTGDVIIREFDGNSIEDCIHDAFEAGKDYPLIQHEHMHH